MTMTMKVRIELPGHPKMDLFVKDFAKTARGNATFERLAGGGVVVTVEKATHETLQAFVIASVHLLPEEVMA